MFEIEEQISELPGFKREIAAQNDKKGEFTKKISRNAIVYERSLLCKTICGLPVPKIYITANNASKSSTTL